MMFRIISILSFLLLSFTSASGKEPVRVFEAAVVEISDGDSITVQEHSGARIKVRLHGIDAPEVKKISSKTGQPQREAQAYGEEALQALTTKIKGKQVRLEVMDTGKKAMLARVWLDNRQINVEMLKDGFAWVSLKHFANQPSPEYLQAEDHARREQHGLWKQKNPQPPWEFKKIQKMKLEMKQFWL
jgi:endonuclease YncB( thermonuclease family)